MSRKIYFKGKTLDLLNKYRLETKGFKVDFKTLHNLVYGGVNF